MTITLIMRLRCQVFLILALCYLVVCNATPANPCPRSTKKIGQYCACTKGATCQGSRCATGRNRITNATVSGYRATCRDCSCIRKRRLVVCASLPRSGSTALSNLVKAYAPKAFAFVEPGRWTGLHNYNLSDFATCSVFDNRKRAYFYGIFWSYACDFVGNVAAGFVKRCKAQALTQEDIAIVKELCLQSDVIFIKFVAQNRKALELLLPTLAREGPNATVFILQRNASVAIQSMYAAEMVWYPTLKSYRTPFARLATEFYQANQLLEVLVANGTKFMDYRELSPSGVPRVLQLMGIVSNPIIDKHVLSRKFLSYSATLFPFPWHALSCAATPSANIIPIDGPACPLLANSTSDTTTSGCGPPPPLCKESLRQVSIVAASPSDAAKLLTFAASAQPATLALLNPCRGALWASCNLTDFANCEVYDWPRPLLHSVLHPAMCTLTGELSPGFVHRCHSRTLTGRDIAALRLRCHHARVVVLVLSPVHALRALQVLAGSTPRVVVLTQSTETSLHTFYSIARGTLRSPARPDQLARARRNALKATCVAQEAASRLQKLPNPLLVLDVSHVNSQLPAALRFMGIVPNADALRRGLLASSALPPLTVGTLFPRVPRDPCSGAQDGASQT